MFDDENMIMDDDIGGSNESIRDVGMDVVVTEGDQTSPEESNPAKKSKRKHAKLNASYAFREQRIFMQYAYAFWRPCVCVNSVRHCLRRLCIFCAPTVCSR